MADYELVMTDVAELDEWQGAEPTQALRCRSLPLADGNVTSEALTDYFNLYMYYIKAGRILVARDTRFSYGTVVIESLKDFCAFIFRSLASDEDVRPDLLALVDKQVLRETYWKVLHNPRTINGERFVKRVSGKNRPRPAGCW